MKLLKSLQHSLFLGLAGSLAISTVAHAQVAITSGSGNITGAKVFIPTTGNVLTGTNTTPIGTDNRAVIYDGQFNNVLLQTRFGSLPTNLLFRASTLPVIENSVNTPPAVGTTATINGTITFRTISSNGTPVFFNRVPSSLQVNFTQVPTATTGLPTTEFIAPNYILQEVGVASSPSSVAIVQRNTPVQVVQYQSSPGTAQDQQVAGSTVPAAAFVNFRNGNTIAGDFKFSVTGGNLGDGDITGLDIASFNGPGNSANAPGQAGSPGNSGNTPSRNPFSAANANSFSFIPVFVSYGKVVTYQTNYAVFVPGLGQEAQVAFDTGKRSDDSNEQAEDSKSSESSRGDVLYIDKANKRAYVAVGLSSRVFPNLVGLVSVNSGTSTSSTSTTGTSSTGTSTTGTSGTGTSTTGTGTSTTGTGTSGTGTSTTGTGTSGTGTSTTGTGTSGTGTSTTGTGTSGTGTSTTGTGTSGTGTSTTGTGTGTSGTGTSTTGTTTPVAPASGN